MCLGSIDGSRILGHNGNVVDRQELFRPQPARGDGDGALVLIECLLCFGGGLTVDHQANSMEAIGTRSTVVARVEICLLKYLTMCRHVSCYDCDCTNKWSEQMSHI